MNLDKFLKGKSSIPKAVEEERMDIENPERDSCMPWVQKYRPNKLDQLAHQQEVTLSLKNILKTGNMPHLLFYGPAGTGKTSAIVALAKQLFGSKFYRERVLELNASDERGIGVVRQKIKKFAQKVCVKSTQKKCPEFKIIVLDEADLMTNDAQSALRRVIEDNSKTTRFCIICNYVTKIIEPLSSRCIKYRFKPIPVEVQLSKLHEICKIQHVNLNEQQISTLLQKGDLRQSINSLQSLHTLKHIPDNLLPVSDFFCEDLMMKIDESSSIKEVYELGKNLAYESYPYDEILSGLGKYIIFNEKDQRKKAILLQILSKAEESLVLGSELMPLIDALTSLFYVKNLKF